MKFAVQHPRAAHAARRCNRARAVGTRGQGALTQGGYRCASFMLHFVYFSLSYSSALVVRKTSMSPAWWRWRCVCAAIQKQRKRLYMMTMKMSSRSGHVAAQLAVAAMVDSSALPANLAAHAPSERCHVSANRSQSCTCCKLFAYGPRLQTASGHPVRIAANGMPAFDFAYMWKPAVRVTCFSWKAGACVTG